jgi:dTDP-4-dehydrorhamnose 3,5-epimerase
MIVQETSLPGAYIIDLERLKDRRGFFARAWCSREFASRGLNTAVVQCNISFNEKRGTLRGVHYQKDPFAEVKLVRCTKGRIIDVIVDLRSQSPTYLRWIAVELSEDNRRQLYVPEGFAHGYQTLVDDSEVFYQVTQFYAPNAEAGIRYDDPLFGIEWPMPDDITISEKDSSWPEFRPETSSRDK